MIDKILADWSATAGTVLLVIIGLFVIHRFVLQGHLAPRSARLRNQVIMLGLTAIGLLGVIMVLPIENVRRGQILTLLGLLVTAAIALSSTTLLGNAMAGIMIRAIRNFRIGDFVLVENQFGRVTELGLFHTEIQTEDRDLTMLPNLYLVTNPVKTIQPSGTIVSARVSLGYDIPRSKVEQLLLEAATKSRLTDPFVQVSDLGDYAVTYRIAGFLAEVKTLLTTRSNLRSSMMDTLHAANVEIVSPRVQTNRNIPENKTLIPPVSAPTPKAEPTPRLENVIFDKAEEAASLESLNKAYDVLEEQIRALQEQVKQQEGEDREKGDEELARLTQRKERLEKVITEREAQKSKKE